MSRSNPLHYRGGKSRTPDGPGELVYLDRVTLGDGSKQFELLVAFDSYTEASLVAPAGNKPDIAATSLIGDLAAALQCRIDTVDVDGGSLLSKRFTFTRALAGIQLINSPHTSAAVRRRTENVVQSVAEAFRDSTESGLSLKAFVRRYNNQPHPAPAGQPFKYPKNLFSQKRDVDG